MPAELHVNAFNSFTLAILLLFVGKELTQRIEALRRYSIPEAVAGGLVCVAVVAALYAATGLRTHFELGARDMLLLYFFAAIGLGSDVRTLARGGPALAMLLALAVGFIVLQNLLGMGMAGLFGLDRRAGLMTGSISLTGGVGTTLAWAPHFVRDLGIAEAETLGLASNMIGLIAACCIGGPIAAWLMRRHHLVPAAATSELEIGQPYDRQTHVRIDYHGVLLAVLWLNVALLLGRGIGTLIALTGLRLPDFVGCLLAGIVLRNVCSLLPQKDGRLWNWSSMQPGVALISDVCLGVFLTMALMGLQPWTLAQAAAFVGTTLALQIALAAAFTLWVVYPCMGRNYESAVMCAGFGGIALGSTATAIANMSAVTREHGAAPRAFIVVPLVCGFFIDLVNAVVIGVMGR
ncbi:sodium/glutamate symporter [Xenophilus sp.]|uniref:sodium/glutamate symporter n=2 Tax=Xenophilus sp. TaxID=1873499 RepID=UPI0037DD53A8